MRRDNRWEPLDLICGYIGFVGINTPHPPAYSSPVSFACDSPRSSSTSRLRALPVADRAASLPDSRRRGDPHRRAARSLPHLVAVVRHITKLGYVMPWSNLLISVLSSPIGSCMF